MTCTKYHLDILYILYILLYINPSFFSMLLLCQKQPNNKMTISLILLVIGLC
jgi:hypothetical protein